jgi:hypothetical protein
LGKFLNDLGEEAKRIKYTKKLPVHYTVIAQYTFDLFEVYPEQILRTSYVTVQMIKRMPRSQILQLRRKLLEAFVGIPSIGEGVVTEKAITRRRSNK